MACILQKSDLLLSCNLNHKVLFLEKHMYMSVVYVYVNRSTCVDIVYAGDILGNMKKLHYSLLFQKNNF